MTLKAIDILSKRSKDRDTGFMLMSEAAVSSRTRLQFQHQGPAYVVILILTLKPVDRQGDARPRC